MVSAERSAKSKGEKRIVRDRFAKRHAHCGPPAPIWKRTCVLGRTTGHERLVLTSTLKTIPMGSESVSRFGIGH